MRPVLARSALGLGLGVEWRKREFSLVQGRRRIDGWEGRMKRKEKTNPDSKAQESQYYDLALQYRSAPAPPAPPGRYWRASWPSGWSRGACGTWEVAYVEVRCLLRLRLVVLL